MSLLDNMAKVIEAGEARVRATLLADMLHGFDEAYRAYEEALASGAFPAEAMTVVVVNAFDGPWRGRLR